VEGLELVQKLSLSRLQISLLLGIKPRQESQLLAGDNTAVHWKESHGVSLQACPWGGSFPKSSDQPSWVCLELAWGYDRKYHILANSLVLDN
jgi:hypothetical protein